MGDRAVVAVEDLPNARRKVTVHPHDSRMFVPISSFETKYPLDLIEKIMRTKGADYLCDELAREEDPNYVARDLSCDLHAYFPHEDFAGKRVLDFGSGSGASTLIFSRFFPNADIVGVELEEKLQSIAQSRLSFYGYQNVTFRLSPSGDEIPADIGQFDLVVLSAVYEHLLPRERAAVIPMIWDRVNDGGYLFLNMTPHRWFPIEHHTTGLPLLNYLPDRLAYRVARRFCRRMDPTENWETYLRRGIRGGTEDEILEILRRNSYAQLLEPQAEGIADRIDLWYGQLNQQKRMFAKRAIRLVMKVVKTTTGSVLVPNLSLVFQKTR